jgi:colanic acid biosynthesis glycosyl transferase WcaI
MAADARAGAHIVFINRFYAPDHSATAQILTDLAEHLVRAGWRVSVITSRMLYEDPAAKLAPRETINGVGVVRVATLRLGRGNLIARAFAYGSFYLSSFVAMLRLFDRQTIAIAKTDPPLIGVVALAAARIRRALVMNWVQDLYPEIASAFGMRAFDGVAGRVAKALRDWSLRGAAHNVAIGERMKDRLAASGATPSRIAVIPNWSDDELIRPQHDRQPALRKELGLPTDAFVLEYSGNLGRAHEVDTLVDAALRLRDRNDIWFLFVGSGHGHAALQRKVAEASLDRVLFRPYQPRSRLSESLAVGDAHWVSLRPEFEGLIVPSKVFGIAAAGRAIIAVCDREGEVAEMISRYGGGVIIQPGDGVALAESVSRLADHPNETWRLGDEARQMLDERYRRTIALDLWDRLLMSVV